MANFKIHLLVVGILFFFTTASFSQATNYQLDSLDAYFQKALNQWQVPGMSIAIVKDGKVLLSKGYGLRNIEKKDLVDSKTIFPIASNTKAFTATAIAMLVDEGKLNWNTKVKDILPYFTLYDEFVTEHFTVIDLLSHRSGLATFSGDLLWYGTDYSRKTVISKLPMLKPQSEYRTTFGYSNIMYIAAGEIIEAVAGISYEDFLRTRILQPLGMNNTYCSLTEIEKLDNVCTPHNKVNDRVFPIQLSNWDNIGGAGILNSNVDDLSSWLLFQLNNGKIGDNSLVSKQQLNKMRTPYVSFEMSDRARQIWPSIHFKAYGLGWSLNDYHGNLVVSHSGGYDGVITYTCFAPDQNFGFVILTNSNSSLYNALSYKILDSFLSNDTTDWSSFFVPYQRKGDQRETIIADTETANKPSLELKEYAGLYQSELYGNALITVKGKKMTVQLLHTAMWEGNVEMFDKDTFLIEFKKVPSLPQGFIYFTLKGDKVEQFIIDVPNPDFDFTEFTFKRMDWVKLPEEK